MADIELRGFSGGDKGTLYVGIYFTKLTFAEPGEDGRGKPIVPRNKFVVLYFLFFPLKTNCSGFFTITLLAFVGKYCLLPHGLPREWEILLTER